MGDLYRMNKKLQRYFAEDRRAKYFLLAQVLKCVMAIIVLVPMKIIYLFMEDPRAYTVTLIFGVVSMIVYGVLMLRGVIDRILGKCINIDAPKEAWRYCTTSCYMVALGFYQAIEISMLLMIPSLVVFYLNFGLDFINLKKQEADETYALKD